LRKGWRRQGWAKEVFERALKVAERIEEAWERAWALRGIAVEMTKAGMVDQALKVAEGIEGARGGQRALKGIAEEMAKAGMEDWAKEVFDQALKVAEGIEEAVGAGRGIGRDCGRDGEGKDGRTGEGSF
jgi:hypothetical protein